MEKQLAGPELVTIRELDTKLMQNQLLFRAVQRLHFG